MPKACSVGNDATGSCTGIALDAEADGVGTGIDVSEAGVNGDAEARPAVEAGAVDSGLVVGIFVVRAGGTYCVMVEFIGTE
jgi:hypothetical protein